MNFKTQLSPRISTTPVPSKRHEFPSKKVVPLNWQKLASVDLHELNSGGCIVEVLQDNLNHIAFCKPEEEVHVQNAAGQRNILKMFRLAQLIIQYLFISQEYIENQMNEAKKEHQLILEKYNEIKEKLKMQIDEAKKLKTSNKNMSESIIYMNSLLTSFGALDHFRCPLCPKAFRSEEFLLSHLQRKHPMQAETVNVSECFVHNGGVPSKPHTVDQIGSTDQKPELLTPLNPKVEATKRANVLQTSHNRASVPLDKPTTSKTKSIFAFFEEEEDSNTVQDSSPAADKATHFKFGNNVTPPLRENQSNGMRKSNDIDTYKLQELQNNYTAMNERVVQLSVELQSQKKLLEIETERRAKEFKEGVDEKNTMERHYETIIEKLNNKLGDLESAVSRETGEKLKVTSKMNEQQQEIDMIKKDFADKEVHHQQKLTDHSTRDLTKEIQKLRKELKSAKLKHLKDRKTHETSFQNKYEKALKTDNREYEGKSDTLEKINYLTTKNKQNKVRKPKPERSTKPILHNLTLEPSHNSKVLDSGNSDTDTEDNYMKPTSVMTIKGMVKDNHIPMSSKESSGTESEHNSPSMQSKFEEKEKVKGQTKRTMYSTESSSEDQEGCNETYSDTRSDARLNLKRLTENNPGLWKQMREVIEEELDRRLMQFNINEREKRLGKRAYDSFISKVTSTRKTLREKYNDFNLIRKRLEHKIENKLDSKAPMVKTESSPELVSTKKRINSGSETSLKRGIKTLSASYHLKNQSLESDKIPPNSQRHKKWPIHVTDREDEDSTDDDEERKEDRYEDFDSSSEWEPSHETRVEIHAQTDVSSMRPVPGSSTELPTQPRRQSFFENKIYDKISEEDWDSRSSEISSVLPEYENFERKTTPTWSSTPLESKATQNNTGTNFDQHQEIKLKKPTGPMVTALSGEIESQLRARTQKKLPGAIDVMGNEEKQTVDKVDQDLNDIESIFSDSDE